MNTFKLSLLLQFITITLLFIVNTKSSSISINRRLSTPQNEFGKNSYNQIRRNDRFKIPDNWEPSDSLLQSIDQETFDLLIEANGEEIITKLLEKSLSNSFTFCHIINLIDSQFYNFLENVLRPFKLEEFPLNSSQIQTTIVRKNIWMWKLGELAKWSFDTLKYYQKFFIQGFTVATLMESKISEHSPRNIIALLNENNPTPVVSPEVCRFLFYMEKMYSYRIRYYRRALTSRIQDCLNNEFLLTAPSVKMDVIKGIDLSWYQFHLIMMSEPQISASNTNLIRYFAISDFEISPNVLRQLISTESKAPIIIDSPLTQEFVYQSSLYTYGADFFHYSENQIRTIITFLDNIPLKDITLFRKFHVYNALSVENLEIREPSSFSKKRILLNMYRSGRYSDTEISAKDAKNLKWISHALNLTEINTASLDAAWEIFDQFQKYPKNVPKVSMFAILQKLLNEDRQNIETISILRRDETFGYWIKKELQKSQNQLAQKIRPIEVNETIAHKNCRDISQGEVKNVIQPEERIAVLAEISKCSPNRGKSQWILSETRNTLANLHRIEKFDFSKLPMFYEAAFSGEIYRELTATELETLPKNLCFDVFAKISGTALENVPIDMGRKLVEIYMKSCAMRSYLSELDLSILGPMVCYVAPKIIESSQRKLITDNLHLFHNCCLLESTAKVIRSHVLKNSIFSRSIIRSLGPTYHAIINAKLVDQLKNMSSYLVDYILSDLAKIVHDGKPTRCVNKVLDTNYKLMTELVKERLIKSTKIMKGCSDRRPGDLTCPIIKQLGHGKSFLRSRECHSNFNASNFEKKTFFA